MDTAQLLLQVSQLVASDKDNELIYGIQQMTNSSN